MSRYQKDLGLDNMEYEYREKDDCKDGKMYYAYAKNGSEEWPLIDKNTGEPIQVSSSSREKMPTVVLYGYTYKPDENSLYDNENCTNPINPFKKNRRVFKYIKDDKVPKEKGDTAMGAFRGVDVDGVLSRGGRRRTRRRHGKRKRSTKRKHTSKRKQSTRRRKSCKRRR